MHIVYAILIGLLTFGTAGLALACKFIEGFSDRLAQRMKSRMALSAVAIVAVFALTFAVTKIDLANQVTGTLPTGNGGTGSTSASTGSGGVVLATSPSLTTPTISSPTITGTLGGNLDAGTNAFAVDITNAGATGTTVNTLAKLSGAGTALIAATTDTANVLGIVTAGAGTTGSAQIALAGRASCVFDGATTANDYVSISATTAGNCHDAGASSPTSGQILGRVLSTNGAGGTYAMFLFGAGIIGNTANVTINFADNEIPTGTINGSTTAFTLAHTPSPALSLHCYLNGLEQRAAGQDFTLATATVTFGVAPPTGYTLVCSYRW